MKTYSYPSVTEEKRLNNEKIAPVVRSFHPSLHTNIPPGSRRDSLQKRYNKWLGVKNGEERLSIAHYYSFHRLLWYFPDGFSNPVALREIHNEEGLSFHIHPLYIIDRYCGTIWFKVSQISLTSHILRIYTGCVGVPILKGYLPRELYWKVWYYRSISQLYALAIWNLPFSFWNPIDLEEGAFDQGEMSKREDIEENGQEKTMGNLPRDQSAPWVIRSITGNTRFYL